MPQQRPPAAAEWVAVARSQTYELVLQRIEDQIVAGNLRVGDRLPAERDLATQLGVSRSSVREAVRILQAQGVVTSSVGTGPQSGTVVAAMPAEAMTRMLRLHLALSSFELAELIDARVTLERSSARLAARLATPEDLARMRGLLEQMDDPSLPRDLFDALDVSFHVAVARAGHNRLVSDVTGALRSSLSGLVRESFGSIDDWHAVRGSLVRDHYAIFEAVRSGDADTAATTVESHIRNFAFTVLAQPSGSAHAHRPPTGTPDAPSPETDER
jgi:GntR family transcriptional repressor for pyruvate dehydrogenase complex